MGIDSRVIRTKKVVKSTLVDLLKTKPINEITVTEICARANVNRTTFYKYYSSPQDLLNKLEKDHLDELQERMIAANAISFEDAFLLLINELDEHNEFYETLFSENGDAGFRNRILELCYQVNMATISEKLPHLPEWQQKALYYFVAEGCNGILQHWLSVDTDLSAEDVASFAVHIVDILNQYL